MRHLRRRQGRRRPRLVERVIEKHLASLSAKHVTQSAAVIIENKTGKVLALAGSRDYFSNDGGQLNGAWVPHSPGSALKPFTLPAFHQKPSQQSNKPITPNHTKNANEPTR